MKSVNGITKKLIASLACIVFLCTSSYGQETSYPVGLKVGDAAPLFNGTDFSGKEISLEQELKKGEVILIFYRGQWCPYCNKALSRYSDSLSYLKAKGAGILAITPETDENINKTVTASGADFPVISDKGLKIMQAYKVNFTLDASTLNRYKRNGIDLDENNGSNGANLPVPATYIIGKNGLIKYVYFDTDYRNRVSVKTLLDNIE